MSLIKSVNGKIPVLGKGCFVAPNSTIVGEVIAGNNCSFWFNSVVRGDVNPIFLGNNVNIQDGAILHCLYKKSIVEIGDNVSVGHHATIHGAKIHENVLIGIGAIILDYTEIGENSIIAAGSVVLEKTIVEPNSIYAGVPAKKIKTISPDQTAKMIEKIARNYIMYAGWYQED
ncbi:MAG: gamma carbonic anhydrase family protein [Bacteroidales bacterium]|nr:gamma carbonic anhydrase family protein [Bacteroidales bacterium]